VRLFVALEIPANVRENLAASIDQLRGTEPRAKWVRTENLHVTLKFLGQTPEDKLGRLEAVLGEVRSALAIELRFHGVGFFPNDKRPRVFWAGMTASANLAPLAGDIDRAAAKLGFPPDTREFTPHLTLARFDPPGLSPQLRAAAQEFATRDFGTLNTTSFHLIQSKTKPTGAEYTTLRSFCFAAEAGRANA
jgi:RNA 2',3'-cyclic 3'-phosphodiesterase